MNKNHYLYYRELDNSYLNWNRLEINEFEVPQSHTEATIKLLELGVIQYDKLYEIASNKDYQLIVYMSFNWADEIDFNEFAVFDFNEWHNLLQLFNDNPNLEIEVYVGTNEEIIITKYYFNHAKTILVSNEFANSVNKYKLENRKIIDSLCESLCYELNR